MVLLGLAATLAAPAFAQQDIQPLLDRIDRLERDVNLLQRQVYRGTNLRRAGAGAPARGWPPPPKCASVSSKSRCAA